MKEEHVGEGRGTGKRTLDDDRAWEVDGACWVQR